MGHLTALKYAYIKVDNIILEYNVLLFWFSMGIKNPFEFAKCSELNGFYGSLYLWATREIEKKKKIKEKIVCQIKKIPVAFVHFVKKDKQPFNSLAILLEKISNNCLQQLNLKSIVSVFPEKYFRKNKLNLHC